MKNRGWTYALAASFGKGLLETSMWLPFALLIGGGALADGSFWPCLALYPVLFMAGSMTAPLWRSKAGPFLLAVLAVGCGVWLAVAGFDKSIVLLLMLSALLLYRGAQYAGGLVVSLAIGAAASAVSLMFAGIVPAVAEWSGYLVGVGIFCTVAVLLAMNIRLLRRSAYSEHLLSPTTVRYSRRMLLGFLGLLAVVSAATYPWFAGWHVSWHAQEPGSRPYLPPPSLGQGMDFGFLKDLAPDRAPDRPYREPWWLIFLAGLIRWVAGHWLLVLAALLLAALALRIRAIRLLLRQMREHFRGWFRRNEPADLPYKDVRRSLRKKSRPQGRIRDRRTSGRTEREEWQTLSLALRVRRLYRELLASAVKAGFPFRSERTPSRNWRLLREWANGQGREEWTERLNAADRIDFLELYERTRYGNKEVPSTYEESLDRLRLKSGKHLGER